MKQNSKAKRGDAERAGCHYVREIHKCVIHRRALKSQYQSVDFFASDVVAKRIDGSHVYVQVTAGQASAVSSRRKKLEKIPWHPSDTVELVQLVQNPDPANARKTLWFFRCHVYKLEPYWREDVEIPLKNGEVFKDVIIYHKEGRRVWHTLETAVPVPATWFRAWKEEEC
jgi:hypothetical protein